MVCMKMETEWPGLCRKRVTRSLIAGPDAGEPEPGGADDAGLNGSPSVNGPPGDDGLPPRAVRAVLTERVRDRQGDLVEPNGLDFAEYLRNPVVLWAHDQSLPPVGRLVSLDRDAERVTAVVQFADTEFGRELYGMYRDGFLGAWSLGFLPRKWRPLAADDAVPPLVAAGEAASGWFRRDDPEPEGGHHILEAEVVEVSAVPVPANPAALTRALARRPRRKATAPALSTAVLTPRQFLRLGMEMLERLAPAVVAKTTLQASALGTE